MSAFPRMRVSMFAVLAAVTLLAGCEDKTAGDNPLPKLGADISQTSVSGISSGAYMAGQFELAHAKIVSGAAIIAGGPWGCAESAFAGMMPGFGAEMMNINKAVNGCMSNKMAALGVPNPAVLAEKAKRRAADGELDPTSDAASDRVYLFSGQQDRTVVPAIVQSARAFYAALGVPDANIQFEQSYPAGHAFVTDDSGLSCEKTGEPYVVDCDYDQAGALLKHIYGKLNARAEPAEGSIAEFDQRPYTEKLGSHGLSGTGLVYIPKSCVDEKGCRVHIAFHGCAQNRMTVGEDFAHESGLTRWAGTNRLIILFPQTATLPSNPQGCWDWWGYTGGNFLTRDAKQIVAVKRMLDRLGG
ncbi:MAG: poly(3-hydroxybutyrate) depolymerase [Hyphomicrobium sp.]